MSKYYVRFLFGALLGSVALAAFAQTTEPSDSKDEGAKKDEDVVVLEKFVAGDKAFDAIGLMPNKPSGVAFGFDKALIDTPRAITVISSQQIESLGIHNTED